MIEYCPICHNQLKYFRDELNSDISCVSDDCFIWNIKAAYIHLRYEGYSFTYFIQDSGATNTNFYKKSNCLFRSKEIFSSVEEMLSFFETAKQSYLFI